MNWFRDDAMIERDRRVWQEAKSLMSEEDFNLFLTGLKEERVYLAANRARILAFLKFFENGEARLGHRSLQDRLEKLLADLKALKTLTGTHFLAFPRNQEGENLRFALHPDYFILEINNVSVKEHDFYLTAERQVKEYVASAAANYRSFLEHARKKLNL